MRVPIHGAVDPMWFKQPTRYGGMELPWNFIQGNVVAASQTVAGIIAIADQGTTNTGTDDATAVTPLKLTSFISTKKLAKVYFATGLTLVADTPLTINHNLGLQNRDAFVCDVKVSNSSVNVDIDSTDVNNLTITSSVAISGAVITIIGF
jgi:hypothetical protein